MMKKLIIAFSIAAGALTATQGFSAAACCPGPTARPGNAEPVRAQTSPARLVLASYEKVSAALAADNLADARSASRTLVVLGEMAALEEISKTARPILQAGDLEKAREAFKKVSAEAVKLASKEDGFYVMNCPTGGKEAVWVQSNREIRNPYNGAKALECGIIIQGGETASATQAPAPGRSS